MQKTVFWKYGKKLLDWSACNFITLWHRKNMCSTNALRYFSRSKPSSASIIREHNNRRIWIFFQMHLLYSNRECTFGTLRVRLFFNTCMVLGLSTHTRMIRLRIWMKLWSSRCVGSKLSRSGPTDQSQIVNMYRNVWHVLKTRVKKSENYSRNRKIRRSNRNRR